MRLNHLDKAASLGMFTYASSVVATPIVLVQIVRELSLNFAEGGGIEAVRVVFLLAILIASGFAAARFGKPRSLAAGGYILATGFFSYALAPSYIVILFAIVLVGLGGGIYEALLNPLVQDEHPDDSGRYLNVVNAFFSVGVFTTVLVVGDLLTRGYPWRLMMVGLGVLSTVSASLFLFHGREAHSTRPHSLEPGDVNAEIAVWSHAREILHRRRFWLFALAMFAGGGAEGAFTYWIASYVQVDFNAVARGGAFATAAFAGGMVVGRVLSGHLVKQEHLHILIISSAVFGFGTSIAAWAVSGLIAFVIVVFASGLSIACFWPSIQSHAATEIPADSTTLFILLSVGGIPGFGLSSFVMGLIAEQYGLRASLLVIPVLLASLAVLMVASRKR